MITGIYFALVLTVSCTTSNSHHAIYMLVMQRFFRTNELTFEEWTTDRIDHDASFHESFFFFDYDTISASVMILSAA